MVPEDLTIERQIELFFNAECVVGAHGAGMTNILFGRDLKVVEIFPCSFRVPHYHFLAGSIGHTYRWIPGESDEYRDDITVDCDRLGRTLTDLGVE